eukprot:Nk52_evm10s280 gene=Nk52_evmTU10s280
MSILPKESIAAIADAAGIANIPDEVAIALAPDAEYRIREVIQEGLKFMRHSKRDRLTTEDINYALKCKNVEPLYGYSSSAVSASKPVNRPKDYLSALGMKSASTAGMTDVYYVEEKEIDLKELVNSALPKFPQDVSMTAHWLAIEGIQPAIPQNINPQTRNRNTAEQKVDGKKPTASDIKETNAKLNAGSIEVKPIVKHVLSKELQLYYEKMVEVILGSRYLKINTPEGKPDPEELSPEALKEEEKARGIAIESLATDPGLHQLLPYFCQFFADKVVCNLRHLCVLKSLMRMVKALLENEYLFVEPYLHQLMPGILTCVVGKRLCSKREENHWELRDYSARVVGTICARFGKSYAGLQSRISKTLLRAFLDPSKPLTTHYGAIRGLAALGNESVRVLILPNLKTYGTLLEELWKSEDSAVKSEAECVRGALLESVGHFLMTNSLECVIQRHGKSIHELPQADIVDYYTELFGFFGEGLTPYVLASRRNSNSENVPENSMSL